MANPTRKEIKRHLTRGVGNLDKCLDHLRQIDEVYYPDYPDHYGPIREIAAMITTIQELMAQFRDERV